MKARLKFTKKGTMKFVGHLDIMRYFQKAIRRCEIDISYSKGFNPHQLISFAAPLGVGLTSDGEYMDLQLESSLSSKKMIEALNCVMNDEIKVIEFVGLEDTAKNAMSIVAAADYKISLKDNYSICENMQEIFKSFYEQEQIIIEKKTKKSVKQLDIKPYLYKVAFEEEEFLRAASYSIQDSVAEVYENGQVMYLQLATGSVINIKPELVMEAFCSYANIEYEPFAYQVHRMEVYADKNSMGKKVENETIQVRDLIPLGKLGFEIED